MRTRLCYLALVLVPLLTYAPALINAFGTPEDFLRLGAAEQAVTEHAHHGILNGALVEISFAAVNDVGGFRIVRAISILLVVLCGLALWQLLERGTWSEIDATFVAVGVMLLPTAQLFSGWGTAWPAALAALLSLAGFAAAESELELGGAKRFVAMLGGVLLYFAAAMCYLPTATMALVPIAALGLTRPLRQLHDLRKWFVMHAVLLISGLAIAWAVDRWMMSDAGLADRTNLLERLTDLITVALPSGWSLFLVGATEPLRVICIVLALIVMVGLVAAIRRQRSVEPRLGGIWTLVLGGTVLLFCLFALASPNWRAGYRSLWPLSGVVLVAVVVAVRGAGDQPAKKPFWHFAALGGLIAVGILTAAGQAYGLLTQPLAAEWNSLRTAVLRANFPAVADVQLLVPADSDRTSYEPEARFATSVASHTAAAKQMFEAAVRDRFSAGLPKGQRITAETIAEGTAPRDGALVFDLTKIAP